VSVHVPAASNVSEVPSTVQISVVELAMVTGRVDVLVALMVRVVEAFIPVGRPKVIVCGVRSAVIVLLRVITLAAEYVPFPAWEAESVQVPAARSVSEVPSTVQTSVVELAMVTVRPEVRVALMVRGVAETFIPVGAPKVILCGVKARVTVTVYV